MVVGMVSVTALFVLTFGWIEDVAARHTPRVCPLLEQPGNSRAERVRYLRHRSLVHHAVGVPTFAGLLVVAVVAQTAGTARRGGRLRPRRRVRRRAGDCTRRPPVPSQAPPRPAFEATTTPAAALAPRTAVLGTVAEAAAPRPLAPAADDTLASVLQRTVEEWRVRWEVPGVDVGVLMPEVARWLGAAGIDQVNGLTSKPDDRFDMGGITKTFTGTIVFQLAAEGRIALDAPLPRLTKVPTFP